MISQNGRQVGAIGLFAIDPNARLRRAENSGVVPDKPPTPILDFTRDGVVQGAVEGSNVDPVREMTRLIEVTRAFDGVTAEAAQSEGSVAGRHQDARLRIVIDPCARARSNCRRSSVSSGASAWGLRNLPLPG